MESSRRNKRCHVTKKHSIKTNTSTKVYTPTTIHFPFTKIIERIRLLGCGGGGTRTPVRHILRRMETLLEPQVTGGNQRKRGEHHPMQADTLTTAPGLCTRGRRGVAGAPHAAQARGVSRWSGGRLLYWYSVQWVLVVLGGTYFLVPSKRYALLSRGRVGLCPYAPGNTCKSTKVGVREAHKIK